MGKRIGYARVSTDDQNLDLQRDALALAGCSVVYEETMSGKSADRPELVGIVSRLEQEGAAFESINERIETTSAAGKLIFHVFAALAEFERNLIRERTRAGLAAARARGRKGGRKPALAELQIREIRALLKDPEIQVANVATRYGVSRTTLYRYLRKGIHER